MPAREFRPYRKGPALDGADVITGRMLLVLDAGVKINITRQSEGPIYRAASGISRYIGLQFP